MGDRTYVNLYVPLELKEKVEEILEDVKEACSEEDTYEDDLYWFAFEEVNYGELPFQENLIEAGIAYDMAWSAGGGFTSGTKSIRFTATGELAILNVVDEEANPPIYTLMGFVEALNIDQLVKYIQKWHLDHTTLPWDNQVEYGQRYRTRQLIS